MVNVVYQDYNAPFYNLRNAMDDSDQSHCFQTMNDEFIRLQLKTSCYFVFSEFRLTETTGKGFKTAIEEWVEVYFDGF